MHQVFVRLPRGLEGLRDTTVTDKIWSHQETREGKHDCLDPRSATQWQETEASSPATSGTDGNKRRRHNKIAASPDKAGP